jgi:quinol monooxygenase YgiN
MIKHIVMWRLKDSAGGCSKGENAKKLKTLLESLKGKIAEIKHIEVGIHFNESESSSDVVLYSEFNSKEAIEAYQKHPEHLKAVEFVKQVCEERRVVDYTV